MYIVCVSIQVNPDRVKEFINATLDNARNTRLELGNDRFDVLQDESDPARFTLYEAYHAREAFAAHQQTAHYLRWKQAVTDLLAQPRTSTKNKAIFFGDGAL